MDEDHTSAAGTQDGPVHVLSDQCPICWTHDTVRIYQVNAWSSYLIEGCPQCGFVFASPRPTPCELDEFYISDYFERTRETHLGYGDYRALAEENARCMWHELEGILRGLSISPRNLLDVGCATGGFLAEATSQGLDGVGVELSKYAVGVARNEFNLTVLQGDIYSPELEKGKYDLLTMWHVLEHLIDPLGALERACELLAPRGTLFIELPNWASLGRKVRGQAWKQLKPPEHINFFTPRSLSATVERAGFDVLRCTSEYPSIMNEARQGGPGRLYRLAKAAAATLACKFGCGGYVRLLARKRDLT